MNTFITILVGIVFVSIPSMWLFYIIRFILRLVGICKKPEVTIEEEVVEEEVADTFLSKKIKVIKDLVNAKTNVVKELQDKASTSVKSVTFKSFSEKELVGLEGRGIGLSLNDRREIRLEQERGNSPYVIYQRILKEMSDQKIENAKILVRIKRENPPRISGYKRPSFIDTILRREKTPIIDPKSIVVSFYSDQTPCFADADGFNKHNAEIIPLYTKEAWIIQHNRAVKKAADQQKRERDAADAEYKRTNPEAFWTQEQKDEARIQKAKIAIMKRALVWYDQGCDHNYCARVGSQCDQSEGWLIPIIENIVCQCRYNERELCNRINAL